MEKIRYLAEGSALAIVWFFFRLLPMDAASALGGWLGRSLGPGARLSRTARENIRRALPNLTSTEVDAVITGMWDNLGRNFGEYPHIGRFYPTGRVEIRGLEHAHRLRDDGIGGIFFSAHYGNWELLSLSSGPIGMPPVVVYRHANNPVSEKLIQWIRLRAYHPLKGAEYIRKSQGLRPLFRALREGKHLAMLVDQKLDQGIPVRFFGREAMTAPALAQLAMKLRIPVVPMKMERLQGTRFRLTFYPPLEFPRSDTPDADVRAIMRQINALFEGWIRARPDHWLWIHNRWPDT
jgi:KDO2-lipid IV(A) lauroyltransferase